MNQLLVAFIFNLFQSILLSPASPSSSEQVSVLHEEGVQKRADGKLEEAIIKLSQATALAPRDAIIRFDYGLTLWWHGHNREALLELDCVLLLARRRAEPDSLFIAAVLEVRGRVLLSTGERGLAEGAVLEAVALNPKQATHHAALGTIYRAGLKGLDARGAYDEALALDPNCDEAKEGLAAIEEMSRWEVNAAFRMLSSSTEETQAGETWRPGGELDASYSFSPETKIFARVTQELKSWDSSGFGQESQASIMWRVAGGVLFKPLRQATVSLSYRLTESDESTHHAIMMDASYKLADTVMLVGISPGVRTDGSIGLQIQGGIQQIFSSQCWAMAQVFHYRSSAIARGSIPQTSITAVATIAGRLGNRLSLRAGGGVGNYIAGLGFPAFFSFAHHASERLFWGASYEYFGGFFSQHQLSTNIGVHF